MEAVLDVEKKYIDKPSIKRVELEYGDMNYIIVNLVEHVIDVDGKLWEYKISDEDNKGLERQSFGSSTTRNRKRIGDGIHYDLSHRHPLCHRM